MDSSSIANVFSLFHNYCKKIVFLSKIREN